MWAVVDCDRWNIRGRNQQALSVELRGLFMPRQRNQPCGWSKAQCRFLNLNVGLLVFARNCCCLDLQAGERTVEIVVSQHLDHLEIGKRSKEVQARTLR